MASITGNSSRTRLSAAESREAIIDAVDSLLRSGPYRDLSVESVMAKAGLSRTIFYRHFTDLPDVVTELLKSVGSELDTSTREAADIASADPSFEHMRNAIRPAVMFFEAHGPLVRAVADAAGADDRLRDSYNAIIRHFTSTSADAMIQAVKGGRLGGVDVEAVAASLNAMNERYLLSTLGQVPHEDAEEVLETLTLIWSRALRIS